jgi:hypothetical protein
LPEKEPEVKVPVAIQWIGKKSVFGTLNKDPYFSQLK